jgi:hypothetical protein
VVSEVPHSTLDRIFVAFLNPFRKIIGHYPKTEHDHIHPSTLDPVSAIKSIDLRALFMPNFMQATMMDLLFCLPLPPKSMQSKQNSLMHPGMPKILRLIIKNIKNFFTSY